MTSTERDARSSPVPAMRPPGSPRKGFLAGSNRRAAGERPPRARPQRRGSPGPIPNPAVKPAFAESTAAPGCGRAGRRARGGRFSFCARSRAPHAPKARRGNRPLAGLFAFWGCRGLARRTRREGPQVVSPCGPSRVLMGFGPPSPSREERWRDCSEVFLASPCAFSCAGAGFG